MSLNKIESVIAERLAKIDQQGTAKRNEFIISGVKPPGQGDGLRFYLQGEGDKAFLRMNSNSYLGLSFHPVVIAAEMQATETFGVGPGAVRFISGTFQAHKALEAKLAEFHNREAALLFSSAYAAMLGVLPQLISSETLVVSDALNHNCIINAIRLAKPAEKQVYNHLDYLQLDRLLSNHRGGFKRVLIVTDGVFSMRGDYADLQRITEIARRYDNDYPEGVITVVDDSHGIGTYGECGRGTEEMCQAQTDVLIATLGKSLGVNGGYVASSQKVIDYLTETAPLYIFSNPITTAEAAAALAALDIVDSQEGRDKLAQLKSMHEQLRSGLKACGFETLPGEHPIVPILIRDTQKTAALVNYLFERGILATGLNFPVVPQGEQEIRLQVSASHTEKDMVYLLQVLQNFILGLDQ